MRKILLVFILMFGIFLVGCSQKGPSQEQIFEKNKECANYMNAAQKREEKYYIDKKDMHQSSEIETIFYSQKNNSCLYAGMTTTVIIDENGGKDISYMLFINDALTYDSIYNSKIGKLRKPYSEYDSEKTLFDQKIRELKGE